MFFLAAAMIVVWLGITLYVLYLSNHQRNLEQELAALEELIAERKDERKGELT
ncbi:MAG: CcmD family protein [Litorilinea sp.]